MGLYANIKKVVDNVLNSVSTAEVVIVQSISDDRKYCSVMPKRLMHDGTNSPIIEHVPILHQKSGDSVILVPPKIGDVGLVITNKFALDTLLIDNGTNPLKSSRQFSINDLVYVGGLYSEISDIPDIAEDELMIYHTTGSFIKFDADGKLYIHAKKIYMTEAI